MYLWEKRNKGKFGFRGEKERKRKKEFFFNVKVFTFFRNFRSRALRSTFFLFFHFFASSRNDQSRYFVKILLFVYHDLESGVNEAKRGPFSISAFRRTNKMPLFRMQFFSRQQRVSPVGTCWTCPGAPRAVLLVNKCRNTERSFSSFFFPKHKHTHFHWTAAAFKSWQIEGLVEERLMSDEKNQFRFRYRSNCRNPTPSTSLTRPMRSTTPFSCSRRPICPGGRCRRRPPATPPVTNEARRIRKEFSYSDFDGAPFCWNVHWRRRRPKKTSKDPNRCSSWKTCNMLRMIRMSLGQFNYDSKLFLLLPEKRVIYHWTYFRLILSFLDICCSCWTNVAVLLLQIYITYRFNTLRKELKFAKVSNFFPLFGYCTKSK